MIVFLDKLTFPQTVKVYRLYQQYYLIGKNSVKNSESLEEFMERRSVFPLRRDTDDDSIDMEENNDMERTELSNNVEVSVITQNPFTNPIVALFGVTPSS